MQDPIQMFNAMLDKSIQTAKAARMEEDRRKLLSTVGQDIAKMLGPVLESIAQTSRSNKQDLKEVMYELLGEITNRQTVEKGIDNQPIIEAIQQAFGSLPQSKVIIPEIKMPKLSVPPLEWPVGDMPIRGWVQLQGVDLGHPLPVQIRDMEGKPVTFFGNQTSVGGGGAGIRDFLTVVDITRSGYSMINDAESALRVTGTVTTSGAGQSSISLVNSDAAYYNSDNPLPVLSYQSSGAVYSVSVVSEGVTLETIQVSGSINSVNLQQTAGSATVVGTGYQDNALRVVNATDAVTSVNIVSEGVTLETIQVSGSIASVNMQQTAGNTTVVGSGYQDNALRVVNATDAITSVNIMAEGVTLETIQVSGSVNSVQAKPIAMTTNPTAAADGVAVFQKSDKIGRELNRPVQVRELLATAYVALATGTEATLLAGGAAGVFNDLISVMCANSSDAAVLVDIRDGTAAGIVATVQVPASGTAGVALTVPIPQNAATNAWTVDMPDITGTTVYVTGLFSKEI